MEGKRLGKGHRKEESEVQLRKEGREAVRE